MKYSWKLITDEDRTEYDIAIDRFLSQTDIPYDSVLCDDCNCLSENHLQEIRIFITILFNSYKHLLGFIYPTLNHIVAKNKFGMKM